MGLIPKLVVFDFPRINALLLEAAQAKAMRNHTKLEMVRNNHSVWLDAWSLVTSGGLTYDKIVKKYNWTKMNREAKALHEKYVLQWVNELGEYGPDFATQYITNRSAERNSDRKFIRDEMTKMYDHNDANAEAAKGIGKTMTVIEVGATVGVIIIGTTAAMAMTGGFATSGLAPLFPEAITVLGLTTGAGLKTFAGTAIAFGVVRDMAKTWEEGPQATVAAVAYSQSVSFGKNSAQDVIVDRTKQAAENALIKEAEQLSSAKAAQNKMAEYSSKLARAGAKKSKRLAKHMSKQKALQKAAEKNASKSALKGTGASALGKFIPVVFATWDAMNAAQDGMKNWQKFD